LDRANYLILTLVMIIFILTCAKQMPPPGGPVDTTPPEVMQIVPNHGATNVSTQAKIEVLFSEGMNRKVVESAIFISPWPSEEIYFRWRRKKLKIEFGDTLKENRTYVLTIGAKSSDLRNNQMKESFSMAFSTGEHIDEGQISGMVYSQSGVEGTLVCAYLLADNTDVDPTKVLADYYTQCNQQGKYGLMYMAPGNYRMFAIRDRDANRKYTPGIDALGVTTSDVNLTNNEKFIQSINFQLTVEDTIPPMIKSVYSINQANIIVRFNEALADFNETTPQKYFKIVSEDDPDTQLKILSCYSNSLEPSNIHLTTENQSAITYKLMAQNLFDQSHNPLDTLYYSATFEGSSEQDTLKPGIIFRSIQDSSTGISLTPEIRFAFSETIEQHSFESSFLLTEGDTNVVKGKFNWKNPSDVSYLPDSSLESLTWYKIHIEIDSIKDLSGNSLADSVNMIHFKTLNEDTLSAIGGEIIDEKEHASGRIFLTAKSERNSYQLVLDETGAYHFENILPGIYTINGFRDADSNGVYTYGQAIPFIPAERFLFYPDSIKVRSRWPNEGNNIIFK
jgi:hypothetical protein